jgi:hypothetical protein
MVAPEAPPPPLPVKAAPIAVGATPRNDFRPDIAPIEIAQRVTPVLPTPAAAPFFDTSILWQQLDALGRELEEQTRRIVTVGNVAGMSTTLLSVGYVIWCLRGGSLVATLLTTLPLWKWLDPLPVLEHYGKNDRRDRQQDEDEERLRSMMD